MTDRLRPAAQAGRDSPLLDLRHVTRRFGGVVAVNDLSFSVAPREIVGLIGPNGSGKSTSVNLISGIMRPSAGTIHFRGRAIERLPSPARVDLGLARTFQTTSLFSEYSCLENVLCGRHVRYRASPLRGLFRGRGTTSEEREHVVASLEILEAVGLGAKAGEAAGTLSSAEQRLLMIAVAMASQPELILLDEPAAGMVAHERRALADLILRLPGRGMAVLVIEHHMRLIMEVCHRLVVLSFGEKIAEGAPEVVSRDAAVIESYLGRAH